MLIDTNDIINSEYIKVKVVLKNGQELEYKLESADIQSIDFEVKQKEYRESLYNNETEKL